LTKKITDEQKNPNKTFNEDRKRLIYCEMIVYDSKPVSRNSRFLVNAETALIRKFMEQNLELGKTHQDIMNELQIKPATYYRHVKRIIDQDSKIWDKVHMDSAKYRAQRLVDDLLSCVNLCKQIMNDPKEKAADRIEARHYVLRRLTYSN